MVYVRVEVVPGAKKERFKMINETQYEVAVREPAARNLANTRVKELLCRHFGVTQGQVRLLTGHRSPRKIFDVNYHQ